MELHTMRIFSIWVSTLASISSTYIWSWIQTIQVTRLCLHFGSVWYWWTIIMNFKKRPDRLWAAVIGSLTLFLFPSSSWRPGYLKVKRLVQTHQGSGPGNQRDYRSHLPHGFSPGLPCEQNGHTGLKPLCNSLLLLLKWPALFSCKTCAPFL